MIHVTVYSAKIVETLELLGAARHKNVGLKQDLEDKTAVCEDLCRDNASQKGTSEWQKYALDDLVPKQHAMELYLKHLTIQNKELEGSILNQRVEALSQQKADTGMAVVLREKNRTITKLNDELEQVRQKEE